MFYIIFCFLELLGELTNKQKLITYTKPLLIPTLYLELLYYNHHIPPIILIGILCSTLGDIILLWRKQLAYFLAGILLFMGTQISYSLYFYINTSQKCNVFLLAVTIYITQIILFKIISDIQNILLKFLVIIYTIMVAFMFYTSILINNNYIILGSSLFVISDSMLGLNIDKNYKYQNLYNALIMVTYMSGQYLILYNI
jgi:alkenylglycerophosphocholine/alkenylglycerophosphoethanolamine hydrolase